MRQFHRKERMEKGGKRTIAWVDSIRSRSFRCLENVVNHQIRLQGRGRANKDSLVGLLDKQGVSICLGVHRNSANAKVPERVSQNGGGVGHACNVRELKMAQKRSLLSSES